MKVNGLLELKFQLQSLASENRGLIPTSDSSNKTRPWLLLSIFLAILLRFGLLHFAETRAPNGSFNGNEVGQSSIDAEEEEQPSDQIGQTSKGVHKLVGGRRYGGCAFCGNRSTTRCSRCKAARYCSETCQIIHWRSVHKYECTETETMVEERHSHGASIMVKKTEREGSLGSGGDEYSEVGERNSICNLRRKTTDASGDALSNCYNCAVCDGPATTRCSRCKAVRYCSAKCLILDWRWHKVQCVAEDVDSTQRENPSLGNVGLLKNSHEEDDSDRSPDPLSLEFYPERTTIIEPLNRSSQEPTKKAQDHTLEGARCFEEEIAKFRVSNEIIFLQSERDRWAKQANFAKERYQNLKKESEHQLFVLKNEKKLISYAEAQARNAVHSLSERLQDLQIAVQASVAEKKKQEQYIQILENNCDELRRELQEERKHIRELTAECAMSHKTAQIAMKEVEEKEKELQLERGRAQLLKVDLQRDVTAAQSRAIEAEAKLHDLDRKIRLKKDKVTIWTDRLGRPAMTCAICLTNEKDLAFGCGHMTCRDCGLKISKCPICREAITSLVRLFPG